jgi:D-hydroxyproline dehydrogenase subunit gamma
MPEKFTIQVNRQSITVDNETTIAVAILKATEFIRTSLTGERRGPLCAMGICFECRATVNGVPHQRTCQMLCTTGMSVDTE